MRVDKAEQEDIVVSKHPRTNGEFRCAAMMALAGLEAYILKFRRESSSSVSCFKVFSFSANYQKVRVFAFLYKLAAAGKIVFIMWRSLIQQASRSNILRRFISTYWK